MKRQIHINGRQNIVDKFYHQQPTDLLYDILKHDDSALFVMETHKDMDAKELVFCLLLGEGANRGNFFRLYIPIITSTCSKQYGKVQTFCSCYKATIMIRLSG